MAQKPLVSVCMITYNHEAYIAQAIEGVLMQKTDFPIELVIGEDCSTDKTRQICLEYQEKYPDTVRLLPRQKNLGIVANYINTLEHCGCKYIASCEGDDYWTNPNKLQYQVEFLESHPSFSGICSNVKIFFQNEKRFGSQGYYRGVGEFEDFSVDTILHKFIVHTPTLTFRNYPIETSLFNPEHSFADLSTHLLLLDKGPIRFYNKHDVVYRIHDGGVTGRNLFSHFYDQIIEFLDGFNKFTNYKYAETIAERQTYLKIMSRINRVDAGAVSKFMSIGLYLTHKRTKLSINEFKNVVGLAFPQFLAKIRRNTR